MKALVKAKSEPGLWMEDVADADHRPNDVLIRMSAAAICGTDMHIYHWDDWARRRSVCRWPSATSTCGEIVEIGQSRCVASWSVTASRARVTSPVATAATAAPGVATCAATPRAWESIAPARSPSSGAAGRNVFKLPDAITDEVASILDPLGNATHTALSFDLVGEDVLITGAGPIGIMAVALARYAGARYVVITDVNPYRLELARKMGATIALNVAEAKLSSAMSELGMTEGFDVGLEMSGNPAAFRDMLSTMNHGGHVAMLGIMPKDTGIDWDQVIFKGLVMKGVYGREMFETWYKMAAALQSGLDVSPVITHRLPVADFKDGFEIMASGHSGKVILDWTSLN